MKEIHLPRQAQLFITNVCPAECTACPHSAKVMSKLEKKRYLEQEMKIEEWIAAIDYFYQRLGVRLFCTKGGEPTAKKGIERIVRHIADLPETANIFSTNGIILLNRPELRHRLAESGMNAVAISFDKIPQPLTVGHNFWMGDRTRYGSREHKAWAGLQLIKLLRRENPGVNFRFVANVMLDRDSISYLLDIQKFLEEEEIYTNICPRQTKCLGSGVDPLAFDMGDQEALERLTSRLAEIKRKGGLIANSIEYLGQLPGIMALQKYKCWEGGFENPWSSDIEPDGEVSFCHWLKMSGLIKSSEINVRDLVSGHKQWGEFVTTWQKHIKSCLGCSWSKEDRVGLKSIPNPDYSRYPNIWFKFTRPIKT